RGTAIELRLGSVPSICHVMVPRAIEKLKRQHPDLKLEITILKIEEVIDYLLLGKGEIAAMSYRLDHPGIDFVPLANGELCC
ncbi:LysR substrate-binding domain-containing protein, partial [Escherichia coli]|uniref:LysR substrate-binding domain-containing protein n=1 Tax=Escherichia coli TaxID=562 RepID=UPI0019538F30